MTIRLMIARARWIALGVVLVLVLGLPALYLFNTNLSTSTDEERGPKTWVVQPGETLTLSADEVHRDDLYRCPGKGGVNGTPAPGRGVGGSGGFSVATDDDGTVTASCEPGPAGDY
jgi:hypothetical protein